MASGSERSGADGFVAARAAMVEEQLRARGISDARVLEAMGRVPRERFVPRTLEARAYEDNALPIGHGQTISQPYIVARCCELLALGGDTRVLEVGGGSGYQAAVLAACGSGEVVTVEIVPELAAMAAAALHEVCGPRVRVVVGDGVEVARTEGPFERIVVAAGAPEVPEALLGALAVGGVLVAPVGSRDRQRLVRVRRDAHGVLRTERFDACVFVPLVDGR